MSQAPENSKMEKEANQNKLDIGFKGIVAAGRLVFDSGSFRGACSLSGSQCI